MACATGTHRSNIGSGSAEGRCRCKDDASWKGCRTCRSDREQHSMARGRRGALDRGETGRVPSACAGPCSSCTSVAVKAATAASKRVDRRRPGDSWRQSSGYAPRVRTQLCTSLERHASVSDGCRREHVPLLIQYTQWRWAKSDCSGGSRDSRRDGHCETQIPARTIHIQN